MPTASEVADYLTSHPEFFEENPALLETLELISVSRSSPFYERQIQVLKERQSLQKEKIELIIDGAKANQQLETGLHQVVLQLIANSHNGSPSEGNLIQIIKGQFNIDGISVFLDTNGQETEVDYTLLSQRVAHLSSVCDDRLSSSLLKSLFPEQDIKSCAFVPIAEDKMLYGILVLGSTDRERFQPHFEVMFLDRLGAIASAYLRPYLEQTQKENG